MSTRPSHAEQSAAAATDAFINSLSACRTRRDWAESIAHRGVNLLGGGRVSVLIERSGSWRVIAITAGNRFAPEADAIRRIESFARAASVSFPQPVLADVGSSGSETPDRTAVHGLSESSSGAGSDSPVAQPQPLGTASFDVAGFEAAGVCQVAVYPLRSVDGTTMACLCIEFFNASRTSSLPKPTDAELTRIVSGAEQALRQLPSSEVSSSASRSGFIRLFGTRPRVFTWLTVFCTFLMWVIPADFEIEATGELMPVNQRRIFAPDDGIVDELFVQTDDIVERGQPLIRLKNPERELELSRVLGEIETGQARLAAVRAARSSGNSPAGSSESAARRAADLSGEELQLQQKLISLAAERTLIEEQLASLTVAAPIAGVIYQRRLRERLESRPVQRGQLLLELHEAAGPWQIELLIPDDVIGYVAQADHQLKSPNDAASGALSGLPIRFTIPSIGNAQYETTLRELSRASYLVEGEVRCPAVADAETIPRELRRPGATVKARILVGRRALGFVWFRELIEFFQRKRFSWSPV